MVPVAKGYRVILVPCGLGMSMHAFFVKEHVEKSDSKAAMGRTLFVGNIDYCGDRSPDEITGYVNLLFGSFGTIESVSLSQFREAHENENNSRYAHVVFAKRQAVKSILNAPDHLFTENIEQLTKQYGFRIGLGKRSRAELTEQFRYKAENITELRSDVNAFLKEFEENEAVEKLERLRQSKEVDADGFMPVHPRKKRKRMEDRRSTSGKTRRGNTGNKKERELKNFYRFQMIEEKKGKLQDLRRKFEEDKQKIAQLKSSRKFKPF